ncbi:MAG TPA: zinc ribbon domain-containing protein [Gaiellaceae bacterium]|nr:zinc ribbon domain-containing protein [Gaiellaceae bacterium]
MADQQVREAAAASTEQACPRCGAARDRQQEYCLECGLRLPPVTGLVAGLRRGWIRRFGWYPGDWIWSALVTLLVAIAGVAVAIALTGGKSDGAITFVASSPRARPVTSTAATTQLPTAPEPTAHATTHLTRTVPTKTSPPPTTTTAKPRVATPRVVAGQIEWPRGRSGWTDVLASYPASGGRTAAAAVAARAARSGLRQVGVLDSSAFRSLHGGYYVVFSGVYPSQSAAQAALAQVRRRGFGSAYTRQIAG